MQYFGVCLVPLGGSGLASQFSPKQPSLYSVDMYRLVQVRLSESNMMDRFSQCWDILIIEIYSDLQKN